MGMPKQQLEIPSYMRDFVNELSIRIGYDVSIRDSKRWTSFPWQPKFWEITTGNKTITISEEMVYECGIEPVLLSTIGKMES